MDGEEVEEIEIRIETPTLTRIPSRGGKIGKTTPDTITKGVKVEAQLIILEDQQRWEEDQRRERSQSDYNRRYRRDRSGCRDRRNQNMDRYWSGK